MKNNKKLVFRSDGASLPEIGTGHIMRNIAIADSFISRKICKHSEISFISKSKGPFSIGSDLVKKSGYKLETVDDKLLNWNSSEEARVIIEINPNLLVIDRLSTKSEWMIELKRYIKNVVSMDDVGNGAFYADAVINAILHDIPSGKARYIGYEYMFLKASKAPFKTKVPVNAHRIVASFGGYDSRNLMGFFLDTLEKYDALVDKNTIIELLVGSENIKKINSWKNQAKKISLKYNNDIRLEVRPSNFFQILANADLAILSGGLTIFDAVSFGIPAIGLPQYNHQLQTIKNLTKKMAIKSGSNEMILDESYFLRAFNETISSNKIRGSLKKRGRNLIDRKGSKRVIDILSSYSH
tara:strand:- start:33930 stop:34991 length:1062 start_codon:yes stop_codon:yes gene_type:complete